MSDPVKALKPETTTEEQQLANHNSHTWIIGCDEGCCCRCMYCDTRWGGRAAHAEPCVEPRLTAQQTRKTEDKEES